MLRYKIQVTARPLFSQCGGSSSLVSVLPSGGTRNEPDAGLEKPSASAVKNHNHCTGLVEAKCDPLPSETYIPIAVLDRCIFGGETFLLTLCQDNIVQFLNYII